MFSKEELIIIKDSVIDKDIIKKIDNILNSISNCNEYLWSFYWNCGRQGEVKGLFKATEEEIERIVGKEVYFGEILGKHSEVYGILEREDITLESSDPSTVISAVESGYNPLEYVRFECSICGDTYYSDEMFDIDGEVCNYCHE